MRLNIGKCIVNERHKKKVTQEELAKFLGISKAAVSKWESGISYPSITILPKLAEFFNITVDELISHESDDI